MNWNSVGQCSIENCVDPPEDNLNLWSMNGANVYTLDPCTVTTTNIIVSTEQTTNRPEITLMGEGVFKSKYHVKATKGCLWSSSLPSL